VGVCAQCAAESPAGFRFCGSCGAPLVVSAADVRKTVTVVFCDLVGSTAMGERSDPEVLRGLMRRYHAELRGILERHGGTVEKFVGDAAMAVFGIPRLHEDDPVRAVRAAVEMREAVASLGLEVRIGVNTGEVVAGGGETLVTGDAVNVAARLEQAGARGEILIGAATERLVRDAVVALPVEPLRLKGKSEAVPAFRVLELAADVPAFTRPIAAPFVGRERELASLERALEIAVDRCAPQLATLVGAPGIGKSRLARELLARCSARVLVGRCLSYGEGITYWPLAELAVQIGDLGAALDGAGDADLVQARIDAALGPAAGAVSSEEIAWGFRRLFEIIAAEGPLIVVFDDIQWAEPTLLDLIEYLAAFARDAPLFFLCMTRPDLLELRPGWSTPRANTVLLTLESLGGAEAELLVDELADLPADMRARIVAAAEGNPLFVEQLVAMQAETGVGELEIPPTLQALLAARIDMLAAEERAVVECGSVEGRLFHRGPVAELLPEPARHDVGAQLLALVRKELIRPDRATLPGDDAFRFGHILIRDAAYEAMPKRQRADLHERFADWLDRRLGDEAPLEIVGYHLEQAYRYGEELATTDAELGARASERLATAARTARSRQDIGAAANLFGRAAELAPSGAPRRLVLVELGGTLYQAGVLARAQEALDEAVILARQADDARTEWRARVELAFLRVRREPEGAYDAALAEAEAAIAALPGDDHEALARAWQLVAQARLRRLELGENARAFEEALRHARQAGDRVLEAELLALSVPPPLVYGPVPVADGLRYVDEMLERMGDVAPVRDLALHLLGHLRARVGDFEGALDAFSQWRQRLQELGKELAYASSAGCLWEAYSLSEHWSGAEPMLHEAYETLERMGEKFALAGVAILLGEVAYRQQRLDEAERYCATSVELGAGEDPSFQAWARMLRAKVLAARGELAQAESLARAAVELVDDGEFVDIRAGMWLDLAEVLRDARSSDTEAAARQALALYEQKGHLVGVARANAMLDATARQA
jgi:class 3 adenylate cyclase/tetratricopeptide (TPR) repeat protein